MKYNKKILNIVEYTSIAGSAIGTVAAIATQQAVYAVAPLTLALSFNVINRNRFQQRLQQQVKTTDTAVQNQLQSLKQKIQTLPSVANLNPITQSLEQLQQQTEVLTKCLDTPVKPMEIEELREVPELNSITESLQKLEQTTKTLIQRFETRAEVQNVANLTGQLKTLEARLALVPEPVDLSEIEAKLSALETQLPQVFQISQQLQALPPSFDLSALEQRITQQQVQYDRVVQHVQAEIKRLSEITAIANQHIDNLPPVDLSRIEEAISSLRTQLSDLKQQFSSRLEPSEIERLNRAIVFTNERIDNLPPLPEPVDLSEIEQVNTKFEQLAHNFQTVNKWELEIEKLKELYIAFNQITEMRQDIENLDVSTSDLHDATWQLTNKVSKVIAQLDEYVQLFSKIPGQIEGIERLNSELEKRTELLDERTLNLSQMEDKLEDVRQVTNRLNQKTERLLNRTNNFEKMLSNLQQSTTHYAKAEDIQKMLTTLSEETTGQVNSVVEQKLAGINRLLKKIQPQYEYKLVYDRTESRALLLKATREVKERLILVCPWLHWGIRGNDGELIRYFRALLQRQSRIDIGWGHKTDMEDEDFRNSSAPTRHRFTTLFNMYSALEDLEKMEKHYPNRLKLKLLGTHEKFLVCDRSWAMLGSHNFLSSGDKSKERELGLLTNNPRIIQDLISRFDSAEDLEKTTAKV